MEGFSCEDDLASVWVCKAILEGSTYPTFPHLEDVKVVMDVGANCGAASVLLAHAHPDATVHAFEPAAAPLEHLRVNASRSPSIEVHPFGLFDRDDRVPFYTPDTSVMGSIYDRDLSPGSGTTSTVELRSARSWLVEQGIERIDVLKVDIEGAELVLLEHLAPLLPDVRVLYVEYDSADLRRDIERLLSDTHHLAYARFLTLDQGEAVYIAEELARDPTMRDALIETYLSIFQGPQAGS